MSYTKVGSNIWWYNFQGNLKRRESRRIFTQGTIASIFFPSTFKFYGNCVMFSFGFCLNDHYKILCCRVMCKICCDLMRIVYRSWFASIHMLFKWPPQFHLLKYFRFTLLQSLMDALKEELKGPFEDLILALMTPTAEYDAQLINKSLKVRTWTNGNLLSAGAFEIQNTKN